MGCTCVLRGLFLAAALSLPAVTCAQTLYNVQLNSALYGWLDQYSLDTATYNYVGPEACVPTSSTNAMTYLQNRYSSYFGTALTGSTYQDWVDTDWTLASAAYMNTTAEDGTYDNQFAYGLYEYITVTKGFTGAYFSGLFPSDVWTTQYPKPAYAQDGHVTWNFIFSELSAESAVIFGIDYPGGGGHELLATGFNWMDANNDGIIQESENAQLYFIDPLDPASVYTAGEPSAGPKVTVAAIWSKTDDPARLEMRYDQYQGALPYSSSNYESTLAILDEGLAVSVPEPGSAGLVLLCFTGFLLMRRRTPCV